MDYTEINFNQFSKINKKETFVILPIGSIEVHGPNLPFLTDYYIAQAFASKLSDNIDSLVLPAIYYSYAGVTQKISGTISISIDAMEDYLYGIFQNIVNANFERIIIINIHKDNDIIIKNNLNKIFENYKIPILYINPYLDFTKYDSEVFKYNDSSYKETSILLASLYILGKKIKIDFRDILDEKKSNKEVFLKKLLDIGYIKYEYYNEMQHIKPVKEASCEEGLKYFDKIIDEVVRNISFLGDYVNDLKKDNS